MGIGLWDRKSKGAYNFMESQWTTSSRLVEAHWTAAGESQAQGRHAALQLLSAG